MKKLIAAIFGLGAVAVLGVGAAVAMQPDSIHVERSITIDATADDLWPHVSDAKLQHAWSPWKDRDPNATYTYTDPTTGVGSGYSWEGNDEVGVGSLTTISESENQEVVSELVFVSPWESQAEASFELVAKGDKTEVTWNYDQEADFGTKMMGLFMNMDDMLGPDYEEGLQNLKEVGEETAANRIEAAEKAEQERIAAEERAEERAADQKANIRANRNR